jgi:predicted CXXCH cytochrome family protein
MSLRSNAMIKFGTAALLATALLGAAAGLSGCASSSDSRMASLAGGAVKKLSLTHTAQSSGFWGQTASSGGAQMLLTQTTVPPAQTQDATSGATAEAEASGAEASTSKEPEAVSSASTEESAVKDAAYCLKCHGPFEKLVERTKDYVTEWDEKANPHRYVPHNSTTIVECSECHDPHPIPFQKTADMRKPNVDYCYSCHHAQTLVNCNQCHKD